MKRLLLAAAVGAIALGANARTITVTENKTEGVVSSHTLTFSAGEGRLLGLYRAYAPSDCGETMADWPTYERVAPIPSNLDTYTTGMPTGWGKTVFAVRYFLMEEEIAAPYDSRVDYIESTRNEYVLTGVSATPSTRFVLKMSDPDTFQNNGDGSAFGAKSGGSGQPGDDRFCITTGHVGNWTHAFSWLCGSYSSGATSGSKFTLQKMAVISNDAAKVYYNGALAYDGSATANFTGSGELAIFAVRVNTATPTYEYDKIRLHGLEIYEGDVLVRNFLPVVTNGVYLLYETVDGKFYNNSRNNGEKRFLGGERIPTDVGALTLHAASQAMVRAEPSANILVTSSGMTLRAFGKTLYRLADGADAVDVYLAYAKKNEALPEPTCVWTGWKDELQTRFNIAIPGLEPSTTYAYSIYVMGGGKRSESYTGTFTTGKIITIASDVSPLVIGSTIAEGDEIRIGAGVHAVTSTIQIGAPRVALVGMGETPADTVLDAGFAANMRIVYSVANNYVLLRNLTFANALKNVLGDKEGGAYYAAHGAAVRLTNATSDQKLAHYHWIESCAFSACTNTVQYGGAVHVDGAAEFVSCDFSDCRSTCGGAVFVHCGGEQTRFRSCTFARNSSSDRGGAVACRTYNSSTSVSTYDGAENRFGMLFDACTFTDNVADGSGGALSGKIVALRDCTFAGNTAANGGGFNVQTWNGTCWIRTFTNVIERCVFSNNVARTGGGGAIYENETRCIAIKGSTFVGNRAYGSGPSAVLVSGNLEAEDTVFVGNRSEYEGEVPQLTRANGYGTGAVVAAGGNGFARIARCTFTGNLGRGRMGVLSVLRAEDGKFPASTVVDTVIARNEIAADADRSDVQRAVLGNWSANGVIRNCLIAANTNACGYGCGILSAANSTRIENCTIADNVCRSSDPARDTLAVGVYLNISDYCRIVNTLVVNNRDLTADKLQNFYLHGVNACSNCAEDGTQLSSTAADKNNRTGVSPVFANPAALDYTQRSKAAGRDKGETLDWMTAEATDISGVTPRVINNVPDIGAFEYPLVPGMLLMVR